MKLHREKKKKMSKTLKLTNASACLSQYLSPNTFSFIESQVKMSKRSRHAYRWKTEDKMLALSIFFHSRKAYKILSQLFILPSVRTLLRDLQKMNIKPGFSQYVLDALTLKVQAMHPTDRNVALVFDEMSIKQSLVYNEGTDSVEGFEDFGNLGQTRYIANHATAFMVRGLASKWKQPVGYFLSSGPIKAKILQSLTWQCIDKVDQTGLNVVALVCDQGSNNRSFIQNLEKVTIEKPFIKHGNKQVFVFYDPPYLLKNVRNNLKKADLKVGDNMVSWQHIVDFYNIDKVQMIQLAPKLTDKHVQWLISYLPRVVRAIVKLIMTKYYWTSAVLQWQNI